MKLSEAKTHIQAAVERMLQRPKSARPFVIVEDTVTGRFVQFCTLPPLYKTICIDCPALPELKTFAIPSESAGANAVRVLRALGLPNEAELKIEESGGREVWS